MKKIEQNTVLSMDWQKSKPSCGGLNSKWQVRDEGRYTFTGSFGANLEVVKIFPPTFIIIIFNT